MKVSRIFVARAATLAALVLFMTAPLAAQRGKWWQDERFIRELGLTPEQSARLEDVFQNQQPLLRQRMQTLDQAEKVWDRLVEKADDAAVMAQVDVVEAARAELNKTRIQMLLRMRRALTADQWAKFTALEQAQRDRGRSGPRPPERRDR